MNADTLYAAALATGRFTDLPADTLLRLCQDAAARHPRQKEALKAVKRQAHIMHGVYFAQGCHDRAGALLRALDPHTPAALRRACGQILALHPSTAERLADMDAFYGYIFGFAGQAASIVDIGCGYHPFALPWMDTASDIAYYAGDIDLRAVALVNLFLQKMGLRPLAAPGDAALGVPPVQADLAFALKLAPVLEQQQKGLAAQALGRLRARALVVSYPLRSLSGRDVGMRAQYARQFEGDPPPGYAIADSRVIGAELVYLLRRG